MAAVATTLVIDFGDTEQGSINAALDSKRNSGRATFLAGDSIYFKIWSEVAYSVQASAGTLQKIATAEVEAIANEILTFQRSALANAQFFVDNITASQWFGTNHGNLRVGKYNNVYIDSPTSETPLGAAMISYNTSYDVWKLTAPSFTGDKFAIVVGIVGGTT